MRMPALLLLVPLLHACTSPPVQPPVGERLADCGSFPNCVNSYTAEGGHAIAPISATPAQWQALRAQLGALENWTLTVEDDDFMQAVVTTPMMGYKDDVQLQYVPAEQVIHVRSSSRLGIGDMGVNRDRVEMLRGITAQ